MGWPVALLLCVLVVCLSVLLCAALVIRARVGLTAASQPMPISPEATECGLTPRVGALEARLERLEASVNSLRQGAKF